MSSPGWPRSGHNSRASRLNPAEAAPRGNCHEYRPSRCPGAGCSSRLGMLFNGIVGAVLAVPIVRLSPLAGDSRAEAEDIESWLSLGATRSVSGRPDPPGDVSQPRRESAGTGRPRISRAGCATSTARSSRYLPSTARTWAARCAGSRSPACSCVRATAASITRMVRARPGLRRAGCSSITYKVEDGNLLIKAGEMPTTG